MTELTRDEVNRYCHEKIRGLCWHEKGFVPHKEHPYPLATCASGCGFTCGTVQANRREGVTPDYCSDSSPRSLLNEVVAMVTRKAKYFRIYHSQLTRMLIEQSTLTGNGGLFLEGTEILATAEQIARAAVSAHQEANK